LLIEFFIFLLICCRIALSLQCVFDTHYIIMSKFIPNLSVDCVIFGYHDQSLNVLLSKRTLEDPDNQELLVDDYTILGHHVYEGENVDAAASRVLQDKTGLSNIYLEQFHTFGDTDRLLAAKDQLWLKATFPLVVDHVISVAYYSLVDSSKVVPDLEHQYSKWFSVDNLPELGFDHRRMIDMALEVLRHKLRQEPVGFELLPEKFTLAQLQGLYEVILGVTLDRRNFRKKVNQMKFVIPIDEKKRGGAHKPPQYYIFSWDVYDRTRKEKNAWFY
jgi:8-oxo-dGTP diphosphatase